MQPKILIATHGKMASGLQSSLEILTHHGSACQTIDAYVTSADYTDQITDFINSVSSDEQGFIFTDLYGGSVNQKVTSQLLSHHCTNIFLITNINLAVIMSIILTKQRWTLSQVQELVHHLDCQVRVVDFKQMQSDLNVDDFF